MRLSSISISWPWVALTGHFPYRYAWLFRYQAVSRCSLSIPTLFLGTALSPAPLSHAPWKKKNWIRNRESSHVFRTENLLRYLLSISPQASTIGKPISWSDMYPFIAEVQLSDIKPAKVDLKNRMCVERWSPCARAVVTCHYLLSACSDIPGLSEYHHCTQNCTTSHDMAEHPHSSSHGHHSQLGQGSLIFQAWI